MAGSVAFCFHLDQMISTEKVLYHYFLNIYGNFLELDFHLGS